MGIPTEIARIKSGVSAAYTAVKNKGVTTSKTKIADLAGEISKIQTGKPEEEKTVGLNMASGNQVILPTDGKAMSKVTVKKPWQLAPEYIRKGFTIGGVAGTLEERKPEQAKSVTIIANKTTTVLPDSGKTLSKVIITTNVSSGGGGGYTVSFDGSVISSVSITLKYADDSTETLDDPSMKTYYNVLGITFSDTTASNEYYVIYRMPASGYSDETLYLMPTATLVLTADASIKEVGK